MTKRICICATAVLLCILLLCGCSDATGVFSPKALLQLPENRQLLTTEQLEDYLGESVRLYYPITDGQQSSPFTLCDLDRDGTDELLVQYEKKLYGKSVLMAMFTQGEDGAWRLLQTNISGPTNKAKTPQLVCFSNGESRLLTVYPSADGQTYQLIFYIYENNLLLPREQLEVQSYLVQDIMGQGGEQLCEVHENEAYSILQLRLYDGPDEEKENELHEVSVSTLDPRLKTCCRMMADRNGQGDTVLLLDFTDNKGNLMSDAIRFHEDRFSRCYTSVDTNIPNFTSRTLTGLSLQDIDNDGRVELPRQGVISTAQTGLVYTVFWYQIDREGEQLKSFGIVDGNCRFYLCFPSMWYGRIYLQQEGDSIWSVRQLSDSRLLLRFTVTSLNSTPSDGQWQAALTSGENALYMQTAEELSQQDREDILQQSRLLF